MFWNGLALKATAPEDESASDYACWWCQGPPRLRSVRAVRAGARRWPLRQRARPYGVQQARKLANARKREPANPSDNPSVIFYQVYTAW